MLCYSFLGDVENFVGFDDKTATSDQNVDPDSVMVQILGRGAAEKDNADTSILSMMDENEAEYQAERLRKFATKFGSPRAAELLTEAHHVLFK